MTLTLHIPVWCLAIVTGGITIGLIGKAILDVLLYIEARRSITKKAAQP